MGAGPTTGNLPVHKELGAFFQSTPGANATGDEHRQESGGLNLKEDPPVGMQ